VVWYSRAITRALGAARLSDYARAFDYGNADFTGDPGAGNGLERSWISSSLKLTPRQQLAFMRKLVNRQLPVSRAAMDTTLAILQKRDAGGWKLVGKTGSAYPRRPDSSFDRARGWGWYIGAATKGDQTLIFVRLDQDEGREAISGGLRARDALLAEWPSLMARQ